MRSTPLMRVTFTVTPGHCAVRSARLVTAVYKLSVAPRAVRLIPAEILSPNVRYTLPEARQSDPQPEQDRR
jgi:hypothetical protein